MSFESALSGETYTTCVLDRRAPSRDRRNSRSMQTRNAASVLPEPVGAEMSVVLPARMFGQPKICGSVGVPNRETNHSRVMGWAQESSLGKRMRHSSLFAFYLPSIFISPLA